MKLRVHLKRRVPSSLAGPLKHLYHTAYPAGIRVWCLAHRLRESVQANDGSPPVPPPRLRFKVGGTPSRNAFLRTGRGCVNNLLKLLSSARIPLHERPLRVLDFGCGCGRLLTWLNRDFPDWEYSGCDTDLEAIRWCQTHLDFARFHCSPRHPPLPLEESGFDLIIANSVFTHLRERELNLWLAELSNRLAPGGVLLLTVHGAAVWSQLEEDLQEAIRQRGHLTLSSRKLNGIFPDWYQTTFHDEEFLKSLCLKSFEKVEYFAEGMGYQDAVLCRNRLLPTGNQE